MPAFKSATEDHNYLAIMEGDNGWLIEGMPNALEGLVAAIARALRDGRAEMLCRSGDKVRSVVVLATGLKTGKDRA